MPEAETAERSMEEAEVVCVADGSDVAEEGACKAAVEAEDIGLRDLWCGQDTSGEASLEG